MNELYELDKSKSNYKNLKYNLNKINDILSDSSIQSDLNDASDSLSNNYTIDGDSKYSQKLSGIADKLSDNKNTIGRILDNVDSKLYSINKDIRELNQDG